MIDYYGRNIEYLRLSLTDRCNLNCIYCNPSALENCNLLSSEDIVKIVTILEDLGIKKVRLTGGEPLLRPDLEEILANINRLDGIKDIPITTNGMGLAPRLENLKNSGITRLNISLDSLDRERFKEITGVDGLDKVLASIDLALKLGVSLKINAVLMRGTNSDEIDKFIDLAKNNDVEVRFIELMPLGDFGENNQDKIIKGEEILSERPYLKYVDKGASGVADLYQGEGFKGYIGFISPVSHKFCGSCNRIRLTSDGTLKPCLGHNAEVDLKPYLNDEEALYAIIKDTIYNKPEGHNFEKGYTSNRNMQQIGG